MAVSVEEQMVDVIAAEMARHKLSGRVMTRTEEDGTLCILTEIHPEGGNEDDGQGIQGTD